jgi:hypothetical protein
MMRKKLHRRTAPPSRDRAIEGTDPMVIGLTVAGVLLIAGLLWQRPGRPSANIERPEEAPANELPPPPSDDRLTSSSITVSTAKEAALPADPWATDEARMREQVRRLLEYAAQAGPDDPFALSEERIRAFQAQGNSLMW